MRQALDAVLEALCRLLFTYDCVGEEHGPAQGPAVVASNHPSYLDAVVLSLQVRRTVFWRYSVPALALSACVVVAQVGGRPGLVLHAAAGLAGWLATRLFPYDRPPGVLAHPAVIAGSAAGGSPSVDSRGRST